MGQDSTGSAKAENKPNLVVFVTGTDKNICDYITGLISSDLSRNYTVIPRTEAVKKKLKELQDYENSGNIDDRQLMEWGRQNNVAVMCPVTVVALDEYLFSAQLTDVKSNTLLRSAEYAIPELNAAELRKAASAPAARLQSQKKQ